VTLLEASPRLGGMVHTEYAGDLVLERGADSVVAAKPATRELCARLGIADRLVGPAIRGALVSRRGQLRRLPAGLSGLMPTRLGPLATSRVLSARGLARAALEPWQPAPSDDDADESLEAFVTRRMGREAYDRLVEPLLTGHLRRRRRPAERARHLPAAPRGGARARQPRARAARAEPRATIPASPFLSLPAGCRS
jgi:oxygen-dependent protoporphyrinogen oxidase